MGEFRMSTKPTLDWREHGVKVIPASQLDLNTPQTPNMTRAAAITAARTGANKLWAGTFTVEPKAKTGPHHHGELETVIYVVRGRARMRWGEHLEFTAELYLCATVRAASGDQSQRRRDAELRGRA
jgi:uncharacterized RmlC-like cupin family protein